MNADANDAAAYGAAIGRVLTDALETLNTLIYKQPGGPVGILGRGWLSLGDLEIYTWPQSWGSTALDRPEIGGAAITTATTTLVYQRDYLDTALVYHGRKLSYGMEHPRDEFWIAVGKHQLPGQMQIEANMATWRSISPGSVYNTLLKLPLG